MNQPLPKIRKAVIPAAGFGTRLFPATKVVKKELFPVIDRQGLVKPTIQVIVEEAIAAGIEEVGIVIQSRDRHIFEELFHAPLPTYHFNKLSPEKQEYSRSLEELGKKVTLLTQDTQEGYGHAVFCTKQWVNDEPFVLFLGDHVYLSDIEISCTSQLVEIYQKIGKSAIALTVSPAEELYHCGCVTGIWEEEKSLLSLTQICEKPDLEYARQYLQIPGMECDRFLTVFGIYILTPKIFDFLETNIRNNFREKGEFQLTNCLESLRNDEGMYGYLVRGRCFDTGMPDAYRQTIIDFRNG